MKIIQILKFRQLIFLCIVICALLVGFMFFFKKNDNGSSAPQVNSQSLQFPTYYPNKLPDGFTFDKSSESKQKDLLTYTISYGDNKKLFVSQQPLPAQDVTENFHNNLMVFSEKASSPVGKATVGVVRGKMAYSIMTAKTWILITSSGGINKDQFQQIVNAINVPTPQ